MPLSIRGGPQSFLRVLSDNRTEGRLFVYCRDVTSEVFLQCYRQAHQEIFGMLEVTTMVDFLMLRLRPALQEPWLEDIVTLRRCVFAGAVTFVDLRVVIRELRSVWESVRGYVRYTGPQHVKSSIDKVHLLYYYFSFSFFWSICPVVCMGVEYRSVVLDAGDGHIGVFRGYEQFTTGFAVACP